MRLNNDPNIIFLCIQGEIHRQLFLPGGDFIIHPSKNNVMFLVTWPLYSHRYHELPG